MIPEISIVVPLFDECHGLDDLVAEIAATFGGRNHEIIFVDDASRDGTREALAALKPLYPSIRMISHERRSGQSRAIRTGVLAARAPIIAMLDGDGQYDPRDATRLAARLGAGPPELGMVAGERMLRRDKPSRRVASHLANAISRRLFNSRARDTGCGMKAFRREVYLRLPYFDHMHRFFPVLMAREGFEVAYEPVDHRPRRGGRSKYTNIGRLWVSGPDVLGVRWLNRRLVSPGKVEEF